MREGRAGPHLHVTTVRCVEAAALALDNNEISFALRKQGRAPTCTVHADRDPRRKYAAKDSEHLESGVHAVDDRNGVR
jgi:hypothetical protein